MTYGLEWPEGAYRPPPRVLHFAGVVAARAWEALGPPFRTDPGYRELVIANHSEVKAAKAAGRVLYHDAAGRPAKAPSG